MKMEYNKQQIMLDYVSEKLAELVGTYPAFNFLDSLDGSISMQTATSIVPVKRYMRGTSQKNRYDFTLVFAMAYSRYTDEVNMQAITLCQEFINWFNFQGRKRNYPDFGPACRILQMECAESSEIAQIDIENSLALYRIPCQVTYMEQYEV